MTTPKWGAVIPRGKMSYKIKKGDSFLPVTSLEYVTVAQKEILLAGEGPKLKAFSKDGQLLCAIEALPFKVVHGIKVLSHAALLVFGQKAFRVITVSTQEAVISLQCGCGVVELPDWILDAVLLAWEDFDCYQLVLITAHNVLISYAVKEGQPVVTRYPSEVSCILYSALVLGSSLDDLTIASGTVFNKILLWHVSDAAPGHVCVRLSFTGHQGVIFSVRIDSDQSRLVSASDDRTVRLWAIAEDWRSQKRVLESSCLLVLYGHTARVWMARLLPECIVSIGEDAVCRVWSYSGRSLANFRGHRGKSIWSMAVNKENQTLATGGGDCSIRVYDLRGLSQQPARFQSWVPPASKDPNDVKMLPRAVFLMGHTALCLTDKGCVFAGQLCAGGESATVWAQVYLDARFSSYSVAGLSQAGVLALGNIHGSVSFLKLDQRGAVVKSVLVQPYSGKVFSLNWTLCQSREVSDEVLCSCGPDGKIVCWRVNIDSLEAKKLACLTLPPSKHRWVTTVSMLHCPTHPFLILCGDRKGSLHLYQLTPGDGEWHDPYQTLQGVHGPNGVTYSCFHDNTVYTCGRNGLCRKYQLGEDGKLTELTKFKPVKGLDWIERVHFTEEDTLFFGFRGANFVVHSSQQNRRLLDVACGGGHRSYAVSPPHQMLALNCAEVLFIKQAEICYGVVELESGFTKSLFQPAFVGLEAESLVILDSDYDSGRALVAVGSEDCNVCLLHVCPDKVSSAGSLEVLHMLQGHVSSVRALSMCSSCTGRILLFSGGSRASLKVWSVGKDLEVRLKSALFLNEGGSKRRKQRAKFKPLDPDVPPECRVMSLTSFPLTSVLEAHGKQSVVSQTLHYVSAGCSDSVIRHYVYDDDKDGSFYPLPTLKSSNKCVICVRHFFHRTSTSSPIGGARSRIPAPHPILCSTSTDGNLTLWDLLPILTEWRPTTSEQAALDIPPVARVRVHQSGVNDFAIQSSYVGSESHHTIVSAGDDNTLGLVYLTVSTGSQDNKMLVQVVRQHVHPTAHASAITGVCFIGEKRVMSTAIDQRLNVWEVSKEDGLKRVSSDTHDVADPSSLTVYNTKQSGAVALVCGVGLQYCTYLPSTTHS